MRVLIVCLDNWNTLGEVPFVLKKAGCEVSICCGRNSWLLYSSFYDSWIERPEANADTQQLIIRLASSGEYDWILPGDEPIIKLMNECDLSEELFSKILPLTKIEHRALLSSKSGLADVCEKLGILSPKSVSILPGEMVPGKLEGIQLPVIVKNDFSWGGTDMAIYENAQDLQARLSKNGSQHIIVQEFIEGQEYPVEAFFFNGELKAYGVSQILSYDKDRFTYSTRRSYFNSPDIGEALKELGHLVGLHGFANIAYIRSQQNGKLYLIEIDTRPTSWVAYTRFAGIDFSEAIRSAARSNTPILCTPAGTQTEVALFHKDVRRCWYGRDPAGLLRWVFNYKGYWRFIPRYDKGFWKHLRHDLLNELIYSKFKKSAD